jgi:hypothetical protein
MGAVLTIAALAILPQPGAPLPDRFDLVEVNHFYDGQGKRVFDQAVWYEWDGRRHQVQAWRLLKCDQMRPRRDFDRGGWLSLWHDGDVFREVRAASFRESWTQYDPELVERDYLPKDRRRDLRKPVR